MSIEEMYREMLWRQMSTTDKAIAIFRGLFRMAFWAVAFGALAKYLCF